MNCRRCGAILPNGVVICPNCGEDNKKVDINQGNLSVNDLMNINNQNNGPKLDFVNDDQRNIGNTAFNNYNNDSFQYNKEIFNTPFMKDKRKINLKPFIILGIVVLFFSGLYLIFGDEFKRNNLDDNNKSNNGVVESGTHSIEEPDDPENPDEPEDIIDSPGFEDENDTSDNYDVKYDPNDPSTDPYNHGSDSGGNSNVSTERKDVEYKTVKYVVPANYEATIEESSNFLFINDGVHYVLFTLDLGYFDYFIGDTSSIAKKMNNLSDEDYEFTVRYVDSTRVGKNIFYLFDFGVENSRIFLVKYNDNYYYQGVVSSKDGSISNGLKFLKDIFATTEWISEEELDEDTFIPSEYNEHIIIRDITNFNK